MIHVVTGHICSGKSTWVRDHAGPDDVVVDMDLLARAMSGPSVADHDWKEHVVQIARVVRWFAIDEAVRLHRRGRWDLWIIHAYPDDVDMARYRRLGAAVKEMEADERTLRARALTERPARAQRTLDQMLAARPMKHVEEQGQKSAFFPGETHKKTCVFPGKNAVFLDPQGGVGSADRLPFCP